MFRTVLTNLIIIGLIILPVQVISAGIENSSMQMSMTLKMSKIDNEAQSKCMHMQQPSEQSQQQTAKKSCCNEHSSHCKSCNNCPPMINAMASITSSYQVIHPASAKRTLFVGESFLNGALQKNLLRPPRIFI